MEIEVNKLQSIMQDVLTTRHLSAPQAKVISEVLVYAELTGKKTQGIVKLLGSDPIQNIEPQYKPNIIKETKLSAFIDGGRNPGILVSKIATKLAIDKCTDVGAGIVGTTNTYSSTGVLGYYVDEIARNDFIGVVMSGSPKGVAPFGSIDPILGTNPIAFGFPTKNDPIIFDMATSAITWYELVKAKITGQELPEGVAIDKNGDPTKNPEEALQGAVYPFDQSHKGSGLSMMIELLTGPLMGEVSCNMTTGKWYCGNLFLAIDPNLFIGREKFKENASVLLDKIKRARHKKGFSEVTVPGDRSNQAKKNAEVFGKIEIEDQLFEHLLQIKKK